MNQEIRNRLRNVVTKCRKLLEDSVSQELEGKYGIFAKKEQVTADPNAKLTHLTDEEQGARQDILDHFGHIKARGFKPKEALDQLVREIAFTHLNRLCAYKMMEARQVYVGGLKFREAVSRGIKSNGFLHYLGMDGHEADERLYSTGQQDIAYRHFLDWLGGLLSEEIGVLFNPNDPANRLYPRQKMLDEVLELLNDGGIKPEEIELHEEWPKIWLQDETIGWVYQYFTPKELRDAARDPQKGGNKAPRNSYELAFRNQFFTPRYVVEFLTDNTLGRTWYEMRKGNTELKHSCTYLVHRPTEIFLNDREEPPKEAVEEGDDLSQEELLTLPLYIPHRPKKDPREFKILDPACGSGHFLLYCFDLLLTIYEEAYADPDLGPALKNEYKTLADLKQAIPGLILAQNLHGIDIDLRASQIAALALWLRCQRTYQDIGLTQDRPKITRSNFVCAEPMPGDEQIFKEFVRQEFTGRPERQLLGHLVEIVFDRMKLAGEAGSLLKIEEEIRDVIAAAKKQWVRETTQAKDRKGQPLLFTQAAMDRLMGTPHQRSLFDLSEITDGQFFAQAETLVKETLRDYAQNSQNGHRFQRRLFTEDAERGFAFVDLCQKRYDVVLMNPPFGSPPTGATINQYLTKQYPVFANNLACAFILRAPTLLEARGMLGAVSDRAVFFRKNYRSLRECLLDKSSLNFSDLGWDVLDEANVEAAAVVADYGTITASSFFDCRQKTDKASELSRLVSGFRSSHLNHGAFIHRNLEFSTFPNHAFAYWVPPSVFRVFLRGKKASDSLFVAEQGLAAADSQQFIRAWWELVPTSLVDRTFVRLAHGGGFSPCFRDFHFAIRWDRSGQSLKNYVCQRYPYLNGDPAWVVKNEGDYFRPGLNYGKRNNCLSVQIMPPDMIFTDEGQAVFSKQKDDALFVCGLLNTRLYRYVVNTFCGQHKHSGYLNSLPIVPVPENVRQQLADQVVAEWKFRHERNSREETGNWFLEPIDGEADSLFEITRRRIRREFSEEKRLFYERMRNESDLFDAAQLSEADRTVVVDAFAGFPLGMANEVSSAQEVNELADEEQDEEGIQKPQFSSEQYGTIGLYCERLGVSIDQLGDEDIENSIVADISVDVCQKVLSYAIGCAYGRWDIRYALEQRSRLEVSNPFDPLPTCPPGMLRGDEDLPETGPPTGYRFRINVDGILVDDAGHQEDVERRVRDFLEVIWNDRTDAIEREACDIFGVMGLREYFRKSSKGGFWNDHVVRYTKSRRKAPIYWLLQSSRRNYALWFYYHRLDKDLLFKALLNYVEPKIRLEENRREASRNQKAAAGESGKEAKRLAKEVEQQEDFISELKDFEDKLRRAASLHLEPDLNDGVVLNIAPLWELIPWKEAKICWEELVEGKYEWSSIGKQLRQKGLVK